VAAGRDSAPAPKAKASASASKGSKDTLGDILAYFTALDINTLTEEQKDTVAEIHAVIENAMVSA
jgi:hypothetical protein